MDGGDHPGWYWPSTSSQTANMEMVGSVNRTKPLSTYRNSDLAFWGRLAYAGHYEGFQIVDAANPRKPQQLVDFNCPGSQHDVSVWQNLLFVSVETPRSSPACDSVAQTPGFEGICIFDVHIFTNDGGRGVDAIEVRDKAVNGAKRLRYSNPQTQIDVVD